MVNGLRSWILFYVVLHLAWAPLLWFFPESGRATALYHIVDLIGAKPAAVAMLFVALLAVLGLYLHSRGKIHPVGLALMAGLQEIVLVMSAHASLQAVVLGEYADGTKIPRAHILADQWPYIESAALHTFAVVGPWAQAAWRVLRRY